MPNRISEKIAQWQQGCPDGPSYNDIDAFIRFRAQESFETYNHGASIPRFETRLEKWLDNLTDQNDQRKLFELVPNLFFLGPGEFKALYRASFQEIILNWLIDLRSIDIASPKISQELQSVIKKTWFCPATDSMDIAAFCHVNRVIGLPDRPPWRYLAKFGDLAKIRDYIKGNGIEQIVILEDFIGSGSQFLGTDEKEKKKQRTILQTLKAIGHSCKVLILPLIACQEGVDKINESAQKEGCDWIECNAAFILSEVCFLPEDISSPSIQSRIAKMNDKERTNFSELHLLVEKIGLQHEFRYSSFGYNGTGSLVVLYTNCSDNTLAIIHEDIHSSWSSLFPRTSRVAP